MEAKELRIGNLLYLAFAKKNVVVFGIDVIEISEITHNLIRFKDGINFSVSKIELFEPILLTEEWLLKFGFEKSNLDEDNAWLELKYRYLKFSSDESVEFKKVYLTINKMDIICKYVHQLQNLYFALTGEELTIKNQE